MKNWFKKIALSLVVVVAALSLSPSAYAVQYVSADANTVTAYSVAEVCGFEQKADKPHIASSAGARAVHSHGYWLKGDCKATKATVTIHLQKKINGWWVDVGTEGKGDYKPGGGRGKRATARYECKGHASTTYRAWVDVDLYGYFDTPNRAHSVEATLDCS